MKKNNNCVSLKKNQNCFSKAINSLHEVECFLDSITKFRKVSKICKLFKN